MSDLRDILERKRAEARPTPGAFDRLDTRRRRRDFRRRATAGTVALLVVVVGTIAAIRLFPTKTEPASPPVRSSPASNSTGAIAPPAITIAVGVRYLDDMG